MVSQSDRPALTWPTKLLYASGAAANAIKARGISTFLLIFYNQVVGLPAAMVSGVIMITLIFDALIDPTIGQVSDNTRSRWGRRHPYMYAAALPVAVAFFLLWNPPEGVSHQAIFVYLLVVLLVIRLFDTFFELPSSALLAELTQGYDERTSLISLRQLMGVLGGLAMTLAVYQISMRENPDGSGGVTERGGYFSYSLTASLLIFAFIIISSLGTHRFIPYLRRPPARKATLGAMAREVAATVNNRSFVVLTCSGMFTSIAVGLKHALDLYFLIYFWGFNQAQLSILTVIGVAASIIGVSMAPKLSARVGKRTAAIFVFITALIISVVPLGLRLIDVMPPNGTALLFWIIAVDMLVATALSVSTSVMLASMAADVVEDSEVKTGRRSEGLLLSADNLFKKMVSGIGVFISGLVLTVAAFPQDAERGQVDPEVLRNLALAYLPTIVTLFALAIGCLFLFRIDKTTHATNLETLRQRAAVAPSVEEEVEAAAPDATGPSGEMVAAPVKP